MKSPAVPPASRAFTAALYSVGGSALNCTLMLGCTLLKAGMIFVFQTSASSLRQLSIVSVWAEAAPCSAASMRDAPASRYPALRIQIRVGAVIIRLPPSPRRSGAWSLEMIGGLSPPIEGFEPRIRCSSLSRTKPIVIYGIAEGGGRQAPSGAPTGGSALFTRGLWLGMVRAAQDSMDSEMMTEPLLIGVDGGGTGCRARVRDRDGRFVG